MCKSDKQEIKDLLFDIKRQLFRTLAQRTERWVEADTLAKEIECLKPEWLKKNGSLLPRTRVEIAQTDGSRKTTHWVYPLHQINEMFANGDITRLTQK